MGKLADEMRLAITNMGANARVVDGLGAIAMDHIVARYARRDGDGEPWERLIDSVGYQEPNGWRWIGEYVTERAAILAFPSRIETAGVVFANGAELPAIVERCSGVELYVTDEAYEFLLCFNHHEFIIAAGAAKLWLEERRKRN
jgi:hypothetical protein